jgi:alpha/beta superfamily hydrolase
VKSVSTTTPMEQACYLRSDGNDLFAIRTSSLIPDSASGVVILAGGRFEQTSGRNRIALRLARALAARGVHSLRLDYHGVGDSTGVVEEFVLREAFVEDLDAAITELREHGIERVGVIGDCFGARTALAAVPTNPAIESLFLVSLPWRDLAKRSQRASRASSELRLADYARRALRPRTLARLGNHRYRGDYAELIRAKARELTRGARGRIDGDQLDGWVSRIVVQQLRAVHRACVPTVLLYGSGAAEDYANDFVQLRDAETLAFLADAEVFDVRVLDQPIAGYRNLAAQDLVVQSAADWFAQTLTAVGETV